MIFQGLAARFVQHGAVVPEDHVAVFLTVNDMPFGVFWERAEIGLFVEARGKRLEIMWPIGRWIGVVRRGLAVGDVLTRIRHQRNLFADGRPDRVPDQESDRASHGEDDRPNNQPALYLLTSPAGS